MLKEHSMLRFYSSVATHCDMRPNHLVCPSGRNTMQAEANTTQERRYARLNVYCEPVFTALALVSVQ